MLQTGPVQSDNIYPQTSYIKHASLQLFQTPKYSVWKLKFVYKSMEDQYSKLAIISNQLT